MPASAPPPSNLRPLPNPPLAHPKNLHNAGNTCYISALLAALFAEQDFLDALLAAPTTPSILRRTLIPPINHLRGATFPTTKPHLAALRTALTTTIAFPPDTSQQDASELLTLLLDALRAPYIPLHTTHPHPASPNTSTERILILPAPKGPTTLQALLVAYFHPTAPSTAHLLPFYTPLHPTGTLSPHPASALETLILPLALPRFTANALKSRVRISPSTALPASDYVRPLGHARTAHTLILRSAVVHLGNSLHTGHYVAYTFTSARAWRRWDDLSSAVISCKSDPVSGLPTRASWREELRRDAYLLLYELVPGDVADQPPSADEAFATRRQEEEDARAALEFAHAEAASVADAFAATNAQIARDRVLAAELDARSRRG